MPINWTENCFATHAHVIFIQSKLICHGIALKRDIDYRFFLSPVRVYSKNMFFFSLLWNAQKSVRVMGSNKLEYESVHSNVINMAIIARTKRTPNETSPSNVCLVNWMAENLCIIVNECILMWFFPRWEDFFFSNYYWAHDEL